MKKFLLATAVALLLAGCGAGQPPDDKPTIPPTTGTQWCTVATNTGNACPK